MDKPVACLECLQCRRLSLPPAAFCRNCGSEDLRQLTVDQGILYSYTRIHVPPEGWPTTGPYIVGVVQIRQGTLMSALYEGVPWDRPVMGSDVRLKYKDDILYFSI